MKKLVLAAVMAVVTGGAAALATPANPAFFTAYFNAFGTLSDGATPAQAAAIAKAQAVFDKKTYTTAAADIQCMQKADKILDAQFDGNATYDNAADAVMFAVTLRVVVDAANCRIAALGAGLKGIGLVTKSTKLQSKLDIDKDGSPSAAADYQGNNRQKYIKRALACEKHSESVLRRYGKR